MDINPFPITFIEGSRYITAEIRPCCKEDNVVDYAVWIKDRLAFTVTKNDNSDWVVAMHNADVDIDAISIQQIGKAIDDKRKQS